MATDRDEQHRQQQELDEIRRSFAEMGARMGSLFEPAEPAAPEGATTPVLPPAPAVERRRPRWQLVGVALLLVLLGTLFGWALALMAKLATRSRERWPVELSGDQAAPRMLPVVQASGGTTRTT